MDLHRFLNALVLLAVLGRSAWWARSHIWVALLQEHGAPPTTSNETDVSSKARRDVQKLVGSALRRCNASVLFALLGDAVAYGTQSQYLRSGFVVSSLDLAPDRLAFQDIVGAMHVLPAATSGLDDHGNGKGDFRLTGDHVGLNTKYGSHLLMTLTIVLPTDGGPAVVDFLAFQRAWHQWQLGVKPHERGKAAEIALKNLERGLVGRNAATLVGDIGATPRLPGIVAAFAFDACQRMVFADGAGDQKRILVETEDRLSRAAREMTMATHDRAEALVVSEFMARVTFRLVFQSIMLPPPSDWHPLDRHTAPSVFWRAVRSVQKAIGEPFLRRVYIDAEHLCMRQSRRAPLGGELGGTRGLDLQGDLDDLASHHTQRLPTPQSNDQQRELFGLSGGINAALPAILYLAWKYERHPAAALTANALLGGNSAGRGVVLGMLLGARVGAPVPHPWLAQLRSAPEAMATLSSLTVARLEKPELRLRYTSCPPPLCDTEGWSSRVVTSVDVQISAAAESGGRAGEGKVGERHVLVELNVTNLGATNMPICPHGKLWLLWEAGGWARGRARDIGEMTAAGIADVAAQCIEPRQWKVLVVNITTSEPAALSPGTQHMVGLLEVVRPLRGSGASNRMEQPGAGNLIRAVVLPGGAEEQCEHFAAKVGRFEIPHV